MAKEVNKKILKYWPKRNIVLKLLTKTHTYSLIYIKSSYGGMKKEANVTIAGVCTMYPGTNTVVML